MAIQWFPGHMHLTRKALAERVPEIDVVIEMLDARLPGSSANPLLHELTAGRPTLKVLNKQDLADPARTVQWLDWYNARPDTRAVGLDASVPAPARVLAAACRTLAPHRGGLSRPLRVLICGVPNVGKSTLMNTLAGRRIARAADEAGVTRTEQRISLEDDFYLYDTPGLLWPRILVPESGERLAASGAVGRNAYDEDLVALALLDYLKRHYAEALGRRFRLPEEARALAALRDEDLLEAIGRRRGALQAGGRVNLQKAAEIVLTDFRSGDIGRVTLETPDEFEAWLAAARQAEAERQAERLARERERKAAGRRSPPPRV